MCERLLQCPQESVYECNKVTCVLVSYSSKTGVSKTFVMKGSVYSMHSNRVVTDAVKYSTGCIQDSFKQFPTGK